MNREEYFRTDWARIDAPRTRFNMPFDHDTTFNTGDIVPLEVEEILPGDALQSDASFMLRLMTPIAPFMSRCYLDLYAFFIPNRIVWTHWTEFQGENNSSAWTQAYQYEIPQCTVDEGLDTGSLGDYMGLPIKNTLEYEISDLYLRAYILVYDEWFRDENIIDPVLFSKGDTHSSTMDYSSAPLKAAKFHDYFTSLLPSPQKGPTVPISGYSPVVMGESHDLDDLFKRDAEGNIPSDAAYGLSWRDLQSGDFADLLALGTRPSVGGPTFTGTVTRTSTDFAGYAVPSNLWSSFSITIESIRNAAVIQHVYERLASSGSRYVESLRGIWGVTPADATLQIPEYLGGKRFQLAINDVISTADTVNSDGTIGEFLGQIGAYSKNKDGAHLVSKAFTEHGIYLVVGTVRVQQHYYQGLPRKFTRKSYFDFFMPQLNNIGNQPVYTRELNLEACKDTTDPDNPFYDEKKILGYSEAWADYRYIPDIISGRFRPNATDAMSAYVASDTIGNDVSLSQDFIEQGTSGINRVLAVTTATTNSAQWHGNFHFNNIWTRRLDPHSIPGIKRI